MRVDRRTGRAAAVAGVAAAMAVGLAVPAAASTAGTTVLEFACNSGHTLCNLTYGAGRTVDYIVAQRSASLGSVGFFEAFGPSGVIKTGPTNTARETTLEVHRTYANGSLICLRFWRYDRPGVFTQVGGNVCTSVPIG
ncbi:hypothetical protein AB0M80_19310 [Amycolatopsis sp. NPDC051045]|uniref:hypothetical protein n=1 Tax=Amycolatopsis sp. NPDC051045 TaxID=3156922 RepID=UPI0034228EEF